MSENAFVHPDAVLSQTLLDAQCGVLGAMLIDPDTVGPTLSRVQASDFTVKQYRTIFQGIQALFRDGKPVDGITVRGIIGDSFTGILTQLIDRTPTSAAIDVYTDLLKRSAMLTHLRDLGAELAEAQTAEDAQALLDKAMDFAYELSKLPEDYQRKLYDAQMDHRFLYGNTVSSWGDLLKSLDAISCPKGEQCCTNAERMWKRNLKQDYVSKNCDGRYHTAKCCNGCDQLYSCKFACEKFADRIAKHKADEKIRKKDEKQAEQDAAQKKIADATASWARFGEARRAAHVKMSDLVQSAFPEDTKYSLSWRVDDWTKKESGAGIHD